jgi:two-component system, NtrC family, sensor kinase
MKSSSPQFVQAIVKITQELHVTMPKDELLALFSGVFRDLFPEMLQCFRILKVESGLLEIVYANGKLRPNERQIFKVTSQALEGLTLTPAQKDHLFSRGNVTPVTSYVPLFAEGCGDGFSFLLCDRQDVYGMVNFEYRTPPETVRSDIETLLPFIHLLVAALRNARLMNETVLLKEYLEQLLYSANAPMVVVDRDGRITLVNPVFEKLSGLSRDEMLGNELLSLIPDVNRTRFLRNLNGALGGLASSHMEVRLPRGEEDSDVAHISFTCAPVHNSTGHIESVVFVGQDLTEVRDLQRQIIHSEKLSTLGKLAAGVAHELNNPLTSITVYTHYLLKKLSTTLEPDDLQKLESIGEGAKRIQTFTRDLVSYARPSSDRPELLVLKPIVERSVSFCEPTVVHTGASVTIDIPDDLRPVMGIEGQMEQIFVNLVTNACHALTTSRGRVDIRAENTANDLVAVSVSDTGKGIPPIHLPRIFEPFFTTKEVGQGTGLGLSIVRNILENHDATIDVKSSEGEGTTFIIHLRAN